MKIAVIGAGAIGNLVAGYLKLKNIPVVLVGHKGSIEAIQKNGLHITGVRGSFDLMIDIRDRLVEPPDIAVLAMKTQDIEEALEVNAPFLAKSIIVTAQNGVCADAIVAQRLPKANIVSSIVMYGATYLEPGHVVHNFEGAWVLGKAFPETSDDNVTAAHAALQVAFAATLSDQMTGMKYLKIFVNANNCIPAVLGVSMQEAFSDAEVSKVSVALWKEGLAVTQAAGIALVALPHFPVENITKLVALPLNDAANIFSGLMAKLSKEPLYGSILQSIKRGRTSEIEYINGEFIRLAEAHGAQAPLNKKLVTLVHQVERTGKFLTKHDLLAEVQNG